MTVLDFLWLLILVLPLVGVVAAGVARNVRRDRYRRSVRGGVIAGTHGHYYLTDDRGVPL